MNYDVSKEILAVNNLVFDGCQELPIDIDFSLPDYCPDMQRILKCVVKPDISSRSISGDRLTIDGNASIHIIYIDADKNSVRCCENSTPFSCSFDLKTTPENAVNTSSIRLEYVNCRAVSPRKVDIHGAFSVCCKVYSKDSIDISSCIDGKDIQQKVISAPANSLVGIGQQQFSVDEILDIAQGKPEPEIIIRSNVAISPSEYKVMDGKVVVKGDAIIKILYSGEFDASNLEVMEYSVPVSQIVDVPGVSEECSCVVKTEILSHNEQIHSESQESNNMLSTNIRFSIAVFAYSPKQLSIVTDAYSTEHNLELSKEPLNICSLSDTINDNFSFKTAIDLPGAKISQIIDVWSDVASAKGSYSDGQITFNGKMNICVLALDSENVPLYIERIAEFQYSKDFSADSDNISACAMVVPTSIGYRISSNNSIEIKVDAKIYSDIYVCRRFNVVASACADEETPKEKDTSAALTIYYAGKGENIWDIARKYYTSVDAIKCENDITGDTIDNNMMLLIPM